jgi:hypothetical protein
MAIRKYTKGYAGAKIIALLLLISLDGFSDTHAEEYAHLRQEMIKEIESEVRATSLYIPLFLSGRYGAAGHGAGGLFRPL